MRLQLLPLTALFAFTTTAQADDATDARAIVEKAITARGQKPDAKLTASTWKDKGKFNGGGFEMEYTGEFAFQGPDKYRFKVTGDFGGMQVTFVGVANAGKAWESAMGATEEMKGEKLDYFMNEVYMLHVNSLSPLLSDKEFKLATAGEKDVNGKKAVGVTVSREKRAPITLYFDKESGLLVKTELKVKDEFQAWKEVPEEVYFSDYKDVGGQKAFSKFKIVRDGKLMIESTVSDQKAVEKLDPKLFEKP